jgi:hypothetical protein
VTEEPPPSEKPTFFLKAIGEPSPDLGPEPQSWLVWRVDANGHREEGQASVELSYEGMKALHRLKRSSGVIARLDPYGETILEDQELAKVIRELEGMVRLVHDEPAGAALIDFVRYLRESVELELSVCFCGD